MDSQMCAEWITELAEQDIMAMSWGDLERSQHETAEERMQAERDLFVITSVFHASDRERQAHRE